MVDPEDLSKVAGESPSASDGLMLSSLGRRSLAAKALRATSAADSRIAESLLASGKGEETETEPAAAGVKEGGAVVLVIGSGGREHAIALKLIDSPRVSHVYVAPGNGGTGSGRYPGVSNAVIPAPSGGAAAGPHDAVVEFAKSKGVSLVAVGPEVPLMEGVVDAFKAAGVPCFGPSAAAARLEASKAFSKDFMARHGLRTARYECFTEFEAARDHVMKVDYRVVVKASGLAAGKGVLLPETKEEAVAALEVVMVKKEFGDAGDEVVVEEFLEGEEVREQKGRRRRGEMTDVLRSVSPCGWALVHVLRLWFKPWYLNSGFRLLCRFISFYLLSPFLAGSTWLGRSACVPMFALHVSLPTLVVCVHDTRFLMRSFVCAQVSILAICDGKTAVCMPGAQDHKRALDGDGGLNTGGMGAYAPAPCLTPRLARECAQICQSTVTAMAAEGSPFVGVLFTGFMLTKKDGPVVLEFNVRMGDPETQVRRL